MDVNIPQILSDEAALDIFDKVIMLDEKPYTKTYTIGGHKITFGTKSGKDWDAAVAYASPNNEQVSSPVFFSRLNTGLLASELISIDATMYMGEESFTKRAERIASMPQEKKDILIDLVKKFDSEVATLKEQYVNFYKQPVLASTKI